MPNTTTTIVTGVDFNVSVPRWVRAFERVAYFGGGFAGLLIAIMAINIIADVVGRFFWNHPLPGTLEHVTYWWMPGAALLALGAAEIRNEHIRVTLLGDGASLIARRIIRIAAGCLTLLVVAIMTYLAVLELFYSISVGEKAQIAQWVILWPSRLIVIVAFVVYGIAIVAHLYRIIRTDDSAPEELE